MAKNFSVSCYADPPPPPPILALTEDSTKHDYEGHPDTLPVNLYLAEQPTIQPIDFCAVGQPQEGSAAEGRKQNVLVHSRGSTVWAGGGGQGGLNLPLPVPFNPGSCAVFVGSRLFAFFRLRNITQCCAISPLFSRLPYTSSPLFSRSPAPAPLHLFILLPLPHPAV